MVDWLRTLASLRQDRTPAVLVTVASVKGSVPRGPGTKMIVTADALHGTIGGGHLEYVATDAARRMLDAGAEATALHRFPLAASLGQCCGGLVNLLLERVTESDAWVEDLAAFAAMHDAFVVVTPVERDVPGSVMQGAAPAPRGKLIVAADTPVRGVLVTPSLRGTLGDPLLDAAASALAREVLSDARVAQLAEIGEGERRIRCLVDPILKPAFRIMLFGAGHVARALVNVLAGLPCIVTWIDGRDDAFPAHVPPNARSIVTEAPEAEVDAAPAGAYFLVMTHSHAIDESLTERILQRADFAYFGLIGSVSKRRQFERRLAARGMPPDRFDAMTCPIGIRSVAGKEPGIIAVAVAAEILQRRAALAAAAGEKPDAGGARAA